MSKNILVTFIIEEDKGERTVVVSAPSGHSILDIVHEYGMGQVYLEGACHGSCACSTCYVIVETKPSDNYTDPGDHEMDMLDIAIASDHLSSNRQIQPGYIHEPRLGCQVIVTKDCIIRVPKSYRSLLLDIE